MFLTKKKILVEPDAMILRCPTTDLFEGEKTTYGTLVKVGEEKCPRAGHGAGKDYFGKLNHKSGVTNPDFELRIGSRYKDSSSYDNFKKKTGNLDIPRESMDVCPPGQGKQKYDDLPCRTYADVSSNFQDLADV